MGLVGATALGVGGMMGAGLYTLLGLAGRSTGSLLPLAFVVAAAAAACSVYSYARLGSTMPSAGGAARFIIAGFGDGVVAGGLNVFQYVAYLIATSLYAAGFAEYAGALGGDALPAWAPKAIGIAVVVVFAVVNLVGSVARTEALIVGVELLVLAGFIVLGIRSADPQRLLQGEGSVMGVVTGAAILYVTYQGFGVVTNASDRMAGPRRQLPRALFGALTIVAAVNVACSTLVVMLLPQSQIEADAGHVLADAGQAVAGQLGLVAVAAAALLATASAVNATLFASAQVATYEARSGQLPRALARTFQRRGSVGLLASAAAVIALVGFFPLDAVGQMTSLAFLVVYGAVSAGHLRIRGRTGARAWPLVAAVILNAALFVTLMVSALASGAVAACATLLVALVGSFAVERWLHPSGDSGL